MNGEVIDALYVHTTGLPLWSIGPGAISSSREGEAHSFAPPTDLLHQHGAQLMPEINPEEPEPALAAMRGELP